MIENPISLIRNTRQTYSKQLERVVTEVEVEIEGAPRTWMPLETLVALTNISK